MELAFNVMGIEETKFGSCGGDGAVGDSCRGGEVTDVQ